MERRRGGAKLAGVLVVCAAIVAGGVTAGLLLTRDDGGTQAAPLPTTGEWAPITVARPSIPEIAGGIPVDIEPAIERTDFSTTLEPLPGKHRYRMTILNVSTVGIIDSFQWYPPIGAHIAALEGSSTGRCILAGVTGFGGNQFPGVVLNPNISCEGLALKPPSCTCLGDGGAVTLTLAVDRRIGPGDGEAVLRTARVVFDRIPTYLAAGTQQGSG